MADTKERILVAALELFSQKGYDAVGVDEIAAKVGIKGPSLYKHFKGKQQLFDCLIEEMTRRFEEKSVFSTMRWDSIPSENIPSTVEEVLDVVRRQMVFVTTAPMIKMVRRLLVIEQFRNETVREIQEKRSYEDIFVFNKGLLKRLVEKGALEDGDLDAMTLQFIAPVSMEIYRVDRNPDVMDEAMAMLKRHVEQFFRVYGRKNCQN